MKNYLPLTTLVFSLFIWNACSNSGIGASTTLYKDVDGDGYGVSTSSKTFFQADLKTSTDNGGTTYVATVGDCDDTDADINPGVSTDTTADGVDQDCSGTDGDASGNTTVEPTADTDDDGDGYSESQDDCDDTNSAVNPAATENCTDGLDNDCDGDTDTDDSGTVTNGTTYYADTDEDSYGDPNTSTTSCSQPEGYVSDNTDCNDSNASVHPRRFTMGRHGPSTGSFSGFNSDCSDATILPSGSLGGVSGTTREPEAEEETPTIDWGMLTIWNGASWEWDTSCDMSFTDNMGYDIIKSYVTNFDSSVSDSKATMKFSLNSNLDHDTDDYAFKYQGHWTTIAYNRNYMRTYNGILEETCDADDNDSYDESGKCGFSDTINLSGKGDIDENFLKTGDKHVAIVLRGFTLDQDGASNEYLGDLYLSANLSESAIGDGDDSVTAKFTTNINGATDKKYKIWLRYTIVVYDSDKVTSSSISNSGSWGKLTDQNLYRNTTTENLESSKKILPKNKNNTFLALTTWGGDNRDAALAQQFHKISAYSNDYEWAASTDGSVGAVDINSYSIAYTDACGIQPEVEFALEDMSFKFLACKDDTVCKTTTGSEDWNKSTGAESLSQTDTITGLPTTE